jgi:hypothetical protein
MSNAVEAVISWCMGHLKASRPSGVPRTILEHCVNEKGSTLVAQYQNRWADIDVYALLDKKQN